MKTRHAWTLILVLACVAPAPAATCQTTNFQVEGPTADVARQVGKAAERYRKQKAVQWLGKEMPAWPERCPLQVTVSDGPACGATTFNFNSHKACVQSQSMRVEGPLDQILDCVLPHEVTHTVLAYHFGRPVPRWADEGGASLSETAGDKARYDGLIRQYVDEPGRVIPLRRLFGMGSYPDDILGFYTESYSVSNFLVHQHDRPTFLSFLSDGLHHGWDRSVQAHYGYHNLDDLEDAWLKHVEQGPRVQKLQVVPQVVQTGAETSSERRTAGYGAVPGPLPEGWNRSSRR